MEPPLTFISLGGVFLLALAAQAIGRRTRLPRVTMLLLLGFAVGPECFDLLPPGSDSLLQRASEIALTMVGFLLGERLVHSFTQGEGRVVILISVFAVVTTALVVFTGLFLLGIDLPTALLLAGIATATAPAATIDVVKQTGVEGKFPDILLGVVAVDDAWGLLSFSLLMAGAKMAYGEAATWHEPFLAGLWDMGGAIFIGAFLGVSLAIVSRFIRTGESSLVEAIGFVFLASGLAIWADVSFILTAMVMGAFVALLNGKQERPFHTIENVELPFMILFLTLAGSSLDLHALGVAGWIGAAYVGLRAVGRWLGGWGAGRVSGLPTDFGSRIGLALMPQAGVALGMALLAESEFPEIGGTVMQIAIGSTVVFELVGPILTRTVLVHYAPAHPDDPPKGRSGSTF